MPYTRLRYHLVIATKYRRPWLIPDLEEIVYPAFDETFERLESTLIRAGGTSNHVHFVCAIPPKHSLSHVINRLKTESVSALKSRDSKPEEFQWAVSYGAFTLNPLNFSDVVSYVANQKQHHRTENLRPPYERCDRKTT